jgi:pilus assembly protein Flp/PilA
MQRRLGICYSTLQTLLLRDDAQDLIEYALLVGLIAFAATTGMQAAASGVNTVFTRVAAILSSATG